MPVDQVAAWRLRDLVAAEVRAQMARQQATGEALALAMGTSPNSVSRRLRGKTTFDVEELDQVARFLDVPLEQLLAPALAERDRRAAMAGRVTTKGSCSTTAGQRLALLRLYGASGAADSTAGQIAS